MQVGRMEDTAVLEGHLKEALREHVGEFHLEVRERGIILYGKTCTYYCKQLAQHLAMEATTLPILANLIEVVER